MTERIGIIGLGRMGAALATKAAAEGFAVTGWTRSGGDGAAAAAAANILVASLSEVAEAADILILSLFDANAVSGVPNALATPDLAGKLVVETSTVSPGVVRSHAGAVKAAGGRLIDAPISGGPDMVAAGTMGLFLGGADEDVARFRAVADQLSDRVAHIGTLGDGLAAKIVNNVALAGSFSATLDALRLEHAMGLDLESMVGFLEQSPGTTPMFKSRVPAILGQDDAVGFSVNGTMKDAGVFLSEAARQSVDLPAMTQMAALSEPGVAAGLGGQDVAAIARLLLDR